MKTTHTAELLTQLLFGIHGLSHDDVKKANYTTTGTEAVIEYNGAFYRVRVEQLLEVES